MSRNTGSRRRRKGTGSGKRKRQRKASSPHKSRRNQRKVTRRVTRPRTAAATRQKSQKQTRRSRANSRLEIAIRELNRGRSLAATARTLGLPSKSLQQQLRRKRLIARKSGRWIAKDNRLRRVTVMTAGRFRALTVRGYKPAHLVGKHHHAVGEFIRTNNLELLKPFEGKAVLTANGRRHILETDPNALHRIAAMDTPPFHEIYDIVSPT